MAFIGSVGRGPARVLSWPRLCASSGPSPASDFIATDVTTHSAVLAWPPAASASAYKVWYRADGESAPASMRTVARPRVVLSGLASGADYEARVRPLGGNGQPARMRFSTAGAPRAEPEAAAGEEPELPLTELSRLEIRVGKVLECALHPDADSLYVEKVDVGEEEPRTIVSGLVKFVPVEELVGRSVLVLANLKPRAMRGVTSAGMLLCASNEDHSEVDPIQAPEGAPIGELVTFDGHRSAPVDPGNRASKAFDRVAAELRTDGEGLAYYQEAAFKTSAGVCFSPKKLKGSVS